MWMFDFWTDEMKASFERGMTCLDNLRRAWQILPNQNVQIRRCNLVTHDFILRLRMTANLFGGHKYDSGAIRRSQTDFPRFLATMIRSWLSLSAQLVQLMRQSKLATLSRLQPVHLRSSQSFVVSFSEYYEWRPSPLLRVF